MRWTSSKYVASFIQLFGWFKLSILHRLYTHNGWYLTSPLSSHLQTNNQPSTASPETYIRWQDKECNYPSHSPSTQVCNTPNLPNWILTRVPFFFPLWISEAPFFQLTFHPAESHMRFSAWGSNQFSETRWDHGWEPIDGCHQVTRIDQSWSKASTGLKLWQLHGSLNVPIEHHPTIRYMVYNGY